MVNIIQLGPLALNALLLFLATSLLLWLIALRLVAKRLGINFQWVRSLAEGAVLCSFIGARLFFALQYWEAYVDKVWTVFYFWQSGYNMIGGLFGVAGYAAYRLFRDKPAKPLLNTLVIATVLVLTLSSTFIALVFIQPSTTSSNAGLAPVRQVPFEFTDAHGQVVSFADYENKPMVLNFWATWCPPCRREMPLLEKSYAKYADQGIAVIAVNVGESVDVVNPYLVENNLTLPVWLNGKHSTNQLFAYVDGQVMPTTLFIHADGRVVSRRVGELSAATLQQGIDGIR